VNVKIKSIKRDGNSSGEIVELSAEEKVPLTLQDALARHKEFEGKSSAWFTDLSLTSVNFFPNGNPLKGKWQNNHYKASGAIKLHLRRMDPDRLLAPKPKKFTIEFKDALDSIGQPDTEVIKLTLE
jgi:hypothetical protein